MEDKIINKKCSTKEHEDIDAVIYCPQCNIYICNKCDNHHKNLFKEHNPFKLNQIQKEEDLYTGYRRENNHNLKILYFCKNHNKLCCDACIIKMKVQGRGNHKDYRTYKQRKRRTKTDNSKNIH